MPDERDSRTVVLLVTVCFAPQGKPHRMCGLVGPAARRLRVRRPGRGQDIAADCYKHRQDGVSEPVKFVPGPEGLVRSPYFGTIESGKCVEENRPH